MILGIVSDVHIFSYPNRNPEKNSMYRLLQGSRVVSQNIIDVFKSNNVEGVIFAGDLVEKSIIRPFVQAEVKYFLDSIMSNFRGGWIIWGNHDLDCKSSEQSMTDSVLGVILPPNLIYAHQKVVDINGTTLAFSNWQPEFDLSWIQNPVDFLITHARINYQGTGNYQSQKLDESKFNLAICGDIHSPGAKGKYVSIGVPQMCKLSDSPNATGIILDTDTKQYKWVDLNPKNNLITFAKTDKLELSDMWDPNTKTYYVYERPANIDPTTGVNVSIPVWTEVETLVNSAIVANNLQNVHNEVLKYIDKYDFSDVDFNFTLTKFSCKNWRSIDECTMYFNEGDKVLIQGENGSGKSSLLTAIKYAFVDVSDTKGLSSLKSFIQFGTKECWTEVEFYYQNNKCRIRRGTKEYGLWINDTQMKYSDKKSFEADVRTRFPFIKYMDIFFLDADHNQLIGSMSVEKKSLIISKVLKLSKIDTYNEIAVNLANEVKKSITDYSTKIGEFKRVTDFIENRLTQIVLPGISLEQLQALKQEGEGIYKKHQDWVSYSNQTSPLLSKKSLIEGKIAELTSKKSKFMSDSEIDNLLKSIPNQIQDLQSKIIELGNLKTKIEFKESELNRLRNEGNRAYIDANNISLNSKCSLCGQTITTPDTVIAHKNELLKKVDEIREKINPLTQELNELKQVWEKSEEIYNQIQSQISTLNNQSSDLKAEKQSKKDVDKELKNNKEELKKINLQLSQIAPVPEVNIAPDFQQKMDDVSAGINTWVNYNKLISDRENNKLNITNLEGNINRLNNIYSELDKYIKLTGPAGEVYSVILNKLAEEFSDNLVKYEVRKYTCRGEHLNLESMYNKNGNWIDYEACSSGQKTILDVNFLQKIIPRIGLLVMDEFLKHLDPLNHDLCIETLAGMNIGCMMISSHMESIAAFNNKSCKLSLDDSGLTQIDFK